eukprot:COSAG02_NODE_4623_length_5153_cov_3.148793_7_plen_44_part_00
MLPVLLQATHMGALKDRNFLMKLKVQKTLLHLRFLHWKMLPFL